MAVPLCMRGRLPLPRHFVASKVNMLHVVGKYYVQGHYFQERHHRLMLLTK